MTAQTSPGSLQPHQGGSPWHAEGARKYPVPRSPQTQHREERAQTRTDPASWWTVVLWSSPGSPGLPVAPGAAGPIGQQRAPLLSQDAEARVAWRAGLSIRAGRAGQSILRLSCHSSVLHSQNPCAESGRSGTTPQPLPLPSFVVG